MNPKKLKLPKATVDKIIESYGVGKHTLRWSRGQPVVIHLSRALSVAHVMENVDKRTEEQIVRKLKGGAK